MDPQSVSFTPQSDVWRLSDTMRNFQQTQQEHAERLMRLERRQDDDARIKSVWGPSLPFPGVLSGGTPQQGSLLQSASHDDFTNFDDDASNNMVRSLHLDAEDEPRPPASTSRANSVRFDASAKPGQWAAASRSSIDLLSRTSSGLVGLGGHPLFERTASHKSDGRQSSAGHSASRANSLGLDTGHVYSQLSTPPPGLAPGLFILGSVPAIIRCWLNTNFKHDSLLYAAVCSGSHKSFLDIKIVEELGFLGHIRQNISGNSKIKLQLYLPEAVPHQTSSRSGSPAPQLPCLTVDFTVVDHGNSQADSKAIQVFLGSDTLRAHNADILFSSNSMTMYDDDRSKLSIPLVRPENDETFKSLYITSATLPISRFPVNVAPGSRSPLDPNRTGPNGVRISPQGNDVSKEGLGAPTHTSDLRHDSTPLVSTSDTTSASKSVSSDAALAIEREDPRDQKSSLDEINSAKVVDSKENADDSLLIATPSRGSSSPAIWGNWRRDSNSAGDWANASRGTSTNYQRPNRDQGIKVLKPITRQTSRNSTALSSQSPGTPSQSSRFFDDPKRRTPVGPPSSSSDTGETSTNSQQLKRSASNESSKALSKDNASAKGTKSLNPIGGASAFGWLNSGQK